jgi:hypothetical protein
MRFRVVGTGSDFHTFYIHGQRWAILGPHGNNRIDIQGSVEDSAHLAVRGHANLRAGQFVISFNRATLTSLSVLAAS